MSESNGPFPCPTLPTEWDCLELNQHLCLARQCSHRCILVSSEVSHRIATMVSRHVRAYLTLACTFRLPGWGSSIKGTHPDRCGTCAICRTSNALHQHQLPKR
ncbi:hypothetical protein DM927_17515 [Salmonella enterica]|nr:hypothetical protein [Salmonella enterica]